MKKTYILFLIALFALVVSCRDESLDPLLFTEVKKGTILALRGTQLDNVYNKGIPGAELFPKIATGTEKFVFDAEYLAEDPASLASVDVYAIKGSGASTSRVLLTNVPFSQFKTDATYPRPWVTISVDLKDILSKLGLANTFPLPTATVNELLTTYKTGINIETDLNLVDGTKVLAENIVAQGLFGSNQFYPAMRLNYAMTDYCSYSASTWSGDFDATELSEFTGSYGPYTVTFASAGGNKFTTDNFYDSGWPLTMEFNPSVDVATQTIKVTDGTITLSSGSVYAWKGSGTYNSCLGEAALSLTVTKGGAEFDKLVWKLKKK